MQSPFLSLLRAARQYISPERRASHYIALAPNPITFLVRVGINDQSSRNGVISLTLHVELSRANSTESSHRLPQFSRDLRAHSAQSDPWNISRITHCSSVSRQISRNCGATFTIRDLTVCQRVTSSILWCRSRVRSSLKHWHLAEFFFKIF